MTTDTPPPPPAPEPRDPSPVQDRGVSPIAGRIGGRQGRLITLAALAAGCGVFLFATWDRGDARDRDNPAEDAPPRQLAPFEPARRPGPPLLETAASDPDAPLLRDEGEVVPAIAATEPDARASGPTAAEQRQALAESARRAPVLAYSRPGAMPADRSLVASPTQTIVPPSGADHALDQLRRISPIGQGRTTSL